MKRSQLATLIRQTGLSLIELMVSLAIGAFLVLGVVTVFLSNRDSATVENSLARLQENGRFAMDLMREDLHRTQFLGCNTGDVFLINMIDDPNSAGFSNTLEGVRGYERGGDGSWAASPPATTDLNGMAPLASETSGGARNGSDVLRLRISERINTDDPNDPLLTAIVLDGSTSVSIDDNRDCSIEQGSRVVVTGCNLTAHLFEVTNALTCNASAPPNPTTLEFDTSANFVDSISATYDIDSEVLLFEDAVWYVADTQRDRNGFDVWSLFRESGGVAQEMIEGVEHMQVTFGQRTPGGGSIRYVDPSDATLNSGLNYEGLISVRVSLLMQGFDLVRDSDDGRVYVLSGEQVPAVGAAGVGQGARHAGGAVQRDVFTTTVLLRNAPEF